MLQVFSSFILAVLGFCLLFQSWELIRFRKRLAALARIEAKLDLVLHHAGLKYVPYANVPAPVITALQSGNKIQAIKLYRAATGADLKETKDLIEEIMATSTSHETVPVAPGKS